MEKEAIINKVEKGRAEFAYKCAEQGKQILKKIQIDSEWFEDDKYKSYIKKISSMILSNGLGQTLAFVISKRQKSKKKDGQELRPGSQENPKNAYDLIYQQLTEYMKSQHTSTIQMPQDKDDLTEWVISCDSSIYRYITQEILAFLNWLKRFAEGMIEEEER